jgi:K+-sensing histidine kinase KdpD
LAQVVANVVENALKYATTRVTVRTGQFEQGRPTVLVEDDGPGIPPQDLERVFERLYQSRLPADRKVSSGLGLAIVDELVKRMGGEVRAESPIGPAGGTRFVIVLQGAVGRASGSGVRTAAPGPSSVVPPPGPLPPRLPEPAPAPTAGAFPSWPGVPASKS